MVVRAGVLVGIGVLALGPRGDVLRAKRCGTFAVALGDRRLILRSAPSQRVATAAREGSRSCRRCARCSDNGTLGTRARFRSAGRCDTSGSRVRRPSADARGQDERSPSPLRRTCPALDALHLLEGERMILRIDRLLDRATASVRTGSRGSRRRAGAPRRQVRRDVDVHELHLPVVQLPQPAGRPPVLRPGREHRSRGVRPHRARRRRHQHHADRRRRGRARQVGIAQGRQGHSQYPALHRRRRSGARPGLEQPPLDGRQRLLVRRSRRGSDTQLLPRDRRAQQQAQGLRDGGASGCACADRLPARPRRRPSAGVRPGARESDGREPHEALPVAVHPDGQDPGVPAAHEARPAPLPVSLLAGRLPRARRGLQRIAPGDRRAARDRGADSSRGSARARSARPARRLRPRCRPRDDRRGGSASAQAGRPAGAALGSGRRLERASTQEAQREEAGLPVPPSGRRPQSSRPSRPAPRREPAARAEWLWSRDDSRAARACGLRRRGLDRAGDDARTIGGACAGSGGSTRSRLPMRAGSTPASRPAPATRSRCSSMARRRSRAWPRRSRARARTSTSPAGASRRTSR